MANLTVQSITRTGLAPTYAAAAGGGDTFTPGRHTFLHVKNGSGGSLIVYGVTPGTLIGDIAIGDPGCTVPAGGEQMFGPFPREYFADPTDGLVHSAYSGVTSLTVAVLNLAQP